MMEKSIFPNEVVLIQKGEKIQIEEQEQMQLVYQFNIQENEAIHNMCLASNNLYNQALYIIKKELNDNSKFLGFNQMDKIMKLIPNLDGEVNYYNLKAQTAQQTLRLLEAVS